MPVKMIISKQREGIVEYFFLPTQLFSSHRKPSFFTLFSQFFIISVVGTAVQPRLMRHWSLFSKCKELGWNSRFLALLAFRSSTEPSENPGVVVVWGCDTFGPKRIWSPNIWSPNDWSLWTNNPQPI